MHELMELYRDRPMDLADASLVALAEELDGPPIVSFDSDFRMYRLRGGALMTVVLEPARDQGLIACLRG